MKSRGCSRFIIARLDGDEIDSSLERYLHLVRKGIAGFIIFGGKLESVREGVSKLQSEAALPLVISSDLERGLGQQLEGGSVFSPAMALGRAWQQDPELVMRSFETVAQEAAYAGINTVFAPVLDIDSNPENPIISTRSFGRDPEPVSSIACAMIEAFISQGIIPCGKHFPGHGDAAVDSHLELPVLERTIDELKERELVPFSHAIRCGIPMIMTGHLGVPALDPSGTPATLSGPALDYLREEMGFSGLITTDALDMGAIARYGESRATLMALKAGADIILHPTDPDALINELGNGCAFECRLNSFRKALPRGPSQSLPSQDPSMVERLSLLATHMAGGPPEKLDRPYLLALVDEAGNGSKGAEALAAALGIEAIIVDRESRLPGRKGGDLIVCASSEIRAYKGGSAEWIRRALERLASEAALLVSFSGPNLIADIRTEAPKAYAYWDSASSGRAVYEVIKE